MRVLAEALPAGPKASHIEVEVVGVGCIVVGPKHNVESLASALVNVSQESCFLRLPVVAPVSYDANSGAIGQYERCDIYGIGARVFAEPFPVIDIAARICAEMLDTGHTLVEMFFRGLLECVVTEDFPGRGQRARRSEAVVKTNTCRGHLDNVYQRTFAAGAVFEPAKLDIGSAQRLQALVWVLFCTI
jgi:hypothetical protein